MIKVFEFDPLLRSNCGSTMKIIRLRQGYGGTSLVGAAAIAKASTA